MYEIVDRLRDFSRACRAIGCTCGQRQTCFARCEITPGEADIAVETIEGMKRALDETLRSSMKLRHQLNEVVLEIPSTRYMDPPDGGDVSLGEQVRRMAAHVKELESILADVSYETRQYSEGFELLWNRVDVALGYKD